jgi:hypothetical protein
MRGAFAVPTPGGAGASLGGGVQVSVSIGDINVNAPGADGREIAQQISSEIRKIMPTELQSAFESIAIQGGGRL